MAHRQQVKLEVTQNIAALQHSANWRQTLCWKDYDQLCAVLNKQFYLLADKLQAAAALNEEAGEFTVFVANGDWEQEEELSLDVKAFEGYRFVEHLTMYSDDFDAANSYENPDVIKPVVCKDTRCEDGRIDVTLKKQSWNMFRFEMN